MTDATPDTSANTSTEPSNLVAYPPRDIEPRSEEDRMRHKNPLGYSVTAPTEEEIEDEGDQPPPAATTPDSR